MNENTKIKFSNKSPEKLTFRLSLGINNLVFISIDGFFSFYMLKRIDL